MAFIVQRLHVACKWAFRLYNIYDIGMPTVNLVSYGHLHYFVINPVTLTRCFINSCGGGWFSDCSDFGPCWCGVWKPAKNGWRCRGDCTGAVTSPTPTA